MTIKRDKKDGHQHIRKLLDQANNYGYVGRLIDGKKSLYFLCHVMSAMKTWAIHFAAKSQKSFLNWQMSGGLKTKKHIVKHKRLIALTISNTM